MLSCLVSQHILHALEQLLAYSATVLVATTHVVHFGDVLREIQISLESVRVTLGKMADPARSSDMCDSNV